MKNSLTVIIFFFIQSVLHAQNVNTFNGSFDYSQNLLFLPSDRGAGINISASYKAGIHVAQPASEIGLGWDLNAGGAIYRSVAQFPDDALTYSVTNMINGETIIGQGALYLGVTSPSPATDYDFATTSKGLVLDSVDFTAPAFDDFNVSAPGFGGQMKLSYLRFYEYGFSNGKWFPSNLNPTRKPQFHFTGDFADTLVSRQYSATVNSSTPFRGPFDGVAGLGYSVSAESFIGAHQSGSSITNQNFDISTGRLATSNFVEYFTNAEIDAANTAAFTSTTDPLTNGGIFIDYKSSHARNTTDFPAEGIGYFRITASNGMTYHYSQPVYEFKTVSYSAPLNYDYSLPPDLTSFAYNVSSSDPAIEYLSSVSNSMTIKYTTENKYAIKWQLTAITGRDYEDSNNNHMVDDGDAGDWISYDYQLWSSDQVKRTPEFGYQTSFSPDEESKLYPQYYPLASAGSGIRKISGIFASVSVSHQEEYYLAKIRTPSHTAIFIMDSRKDEKGSYATAYVPSGFKPEPSLCIKKIMLFKNAELANYSSPAFNYSDYSFYGAFTFTNVNSSNLIYNVAWYNYLIGAGGASAILKNVEFDQDYSLSKKYHGNIEVGCSSNPSPLTDPITVHSNLTVGTYSSSGKLTLNRILTYDDQNIKVTPSTVFDYKVNVASNNPDFDPVKTDYWGFYKSDATKYGHSLYTSPVSKDYTKAWSLGSIKDPLGGITEMEYESNSYKSVIDADKGVRGPAFIYRISTANIIADSYSVTMEEGATSTDILPEFISLAGSTDPTLKKTVCIPHCSPFSPSFAPSGDYIFDISSGESTLSIVTQSANYSNYICGFITASVDGAHKSDILSNIYSIGANIGYTACLPDYPGGTLMLDYSLNTTYSGGGFILFDAPVGYEAYGGGIRVKSIKTYNSSSEIYTQEYTYENGVATNEMDRFDYQALRTYAATSALRYDYLRAKTIDMFEMSPSIGYSKVTVKDLGRINTPKGKVETTFITTPDYNSGQFPNFVMSTFLSITSDGIQTQVINECQNKFSSVFGATRQTTVFDKNSNQVSKIINDYQSTQQGALTQLCNFNNATEHLATVNILRDIPVVLKSVTYYGPGTVKKSETLVRDELTGESTLLRSSGINKSSSLSYKVPGYNYYFGLESLDFSTAAARRMFPLGQDLYTYSNIDTTLTPAQSGGYSASFLKANYTTCSRKLRALSYSGATGIMSPGDVTLGYYINNRQFQFDGGAGSSNVYGLLNKSALATNTLDLAATNTVSIWEPSTSYNWRLINEITLIDIKKHTIETRDMNNRFSATKYCWNNYYQNATVSNCNYASFTFADFESLPVGSYTNGAKRFDGDVLATTYTLNTSTAHTGKTSIGVSTAPVQFISLSAKSAASTLDLGLLPGRIYRASVWVHTTNLSNAELNISLTGQVSSSVISTSSIANASNNLVTTIGSWNLIQTDFEVPTGFSTGSSGGQFVVQLKSNSGTVLFDDFILHPVESNFSANVYDGRTGRVVSSLDANGIATNFFYDASGKIVETWKEIPYAAGSAGVYKKVSSTTYNYARGASN